MAEGNEERGKKGGEIRRDKLHKEYEKLKWEQARLGQDPISKERLRCHRDAMKFWKVIETKTWKWRVALLHFKKQGFGENGEYPEDIPIDSSIKTKFSNLKNSRTLKEWILWKQNIT